MLGMRMPNPPSSLFVGSLAKGLKILRAFDSSETELALSELVRKTGLDKNSVQRLANTLYLEGFLYKDELSRRFRPSLAWLELANAYYWSDPLVALAMPKLIDLSRELGETVNLARLTQAHVIYVFRLPTTKSRFPATIAGSKLPALGTASGRAMLATWEKDARDSALQDWPLRAATPATILDRTRIAEDVASAARDGYSITYDQAMVNEISIAAPIRNQAGYAVAAVQCSVSRLNWQPDQIATKIVPALTTTANSILDPLRAE
ncbi:IclR family transcriptional regulator [Sulfitobacter maritimus]|uniref:IclR family transcriptional regulator n=2 Tax=Sulfitobacter maritimus TaxID=2741719 RepID=UPI0031B60846